MGALGPGAAAVFPLRFGRQAVTGALQIIGGEPHSFGILSVLVRQIAPLGFGNALLSAQPVTVLRRLVPGDADDRAIRIRGPAAQLAVSESRIEAIALRHGDVVGGDGEAPADVPRVD